jgi:periplasmic divalent cation tolerance protein
VTAALVEIVTTVGSEEDARRLSLELVRSSLVACATFFPVRSIFPWRGAVSDEAEFQVTCKTLASRAGAAEEAIRTLHPYDTPAILRVPVLAANEAYAAWVEDAVRGGGA